MVLSPQISVIISRSILFNITLVPLNLEFCCILIWRRHLFSVDVSFSIKQYSTMIHSAISISTSQMIPLSIM